MPRTIFRSRSELFRFVLDCSMHRICDRGREKISSAAYGPDDGACRPVRLQLLSQPHDQDVDAAVEIIPTALVHSLEQLFPAQHLSGRREELGKQIEFSGREL